MKSFVTSDKYDEKCNVCGKEIVNRADRLSMAGNIIHSSCFNCTKCGESLLKLPYGILDKNYYCKKHHQEMLKEGGGSVSKARTLFQTDRLRSYSTSALATPNFDNTSRSYATSSTPRATKKPLLRVTIIKAVGLAAKDDNGFSDPYVKIIIRGKSLQTKIKQKTLNPTWQESFEMFAGKDDQLKFQCWDYDEGTFGDFLGEAVVSCSEILDKLANTQSIDESYVLQPFKKSQSDITGTLHVSFALTIFQSDFQAKEKVFADRFTRFLETCRFSSDNIRDWLALPTTDSKKRKMQELATAKAKQISDILKKNTNVPKSFVVDLGKLVTEKFFLKAFSAIEGSIEALVIFLTDPHVKSGSDKVEIPPPTLEEITESYKSTPYSTPRGTSSFQPSQLSLTPRTKSYIRSTSMPVLSVDKTVSSVDNTNQSGLTYEISGRNAAGGTEGSLCTFSVFFRLDGKQIPGPVNKDDLKVYIDCPGGPPPNLMIMPGSSGAGAYYQIGFKPKAGQHWFDFVWKGQWCKKPFLLKIQNKTNVVPDHPYTGQERKDAGIKEDSSSSSTTTSQPSVPNIPEPIPEKSEKQEEKPSFSVPKLNLIFEEAQGEILLEDQQQVRISLIEIIRDYMLSYAKTAYIIVDPTIINTIVESIADTGIELQFISLFGLLGIIPTVSRIFDGIRWDGRSIVLNVMKHFQQISGEERLFQILVNTLKYTDNVSHALNSFVLVNSLLDGDQIDERCEIRNQLISCDILGAIKSIKQKFPNNPSLKIQITEFEEEMAEDQKLLKDHTEKIDPKAIVQLILQNIENNSIANRSIENIMKSLLEISKISQINLSEIEEFVNLLMRTRHDYDDISLQNSRPRNMADDKFNYEGPVPKKEIRNFLWRESDIPREETIFANFQPENVKIDPNLLEEMFSQKETISELPDKETNSESTPSEIQPKTKISLLSVNRRTEICIYLNKLSRNNEDGIKSFKNLFIEFNMEQLNEKTLEDTLTYIPTHEEMYYLMEWISDNPDKNPENELNLADYFHYLVISEINDIVERIQLMELFFSFQKSIPSLLDNLDKIDNNSNLIKNNKEIPTIIEVTYTVGLYLNSKNPKLSNLNTFDIEILTKLKEIKSNDNRSLLDYIVNLISNRYTNLNHNWFQDIITKLSPSIRVPWTKIEKDLYQLKDNIELAQKYSQIISCKEATEHFEKYRKELTQVIQKQNDIYTSLSEIEKGFGLDINDYQPDKFFTFIYNFAQDYKASTLRISLQREKERIKKETVLERRKSEISNRNQINSTKANLQKKVIPKIRIDEAREKESSYQVKDSIEELVAKGRTKNKK